MKRTIFTALLALSILPIGAGCADGEGVENSRGESGLELVPISERDELAMQVFSGLAADAEANGQLSIHWEEIHDPAVAFVEIWRPDLTKWAVLAGGDWNPALDHWGEQVARIPAGPANWLDLQAMVLDDNRYILRTIGLSGEVLNGFVVEARPAAVTLRASNWSDAEMNGVGTHDIKGEYVNVRGDDASTILFSANRGDLGTLTYATQEFAGYTYYEMYFHSGVHAGERGWVAQDFLRWSVLDVCQNAEIREGEDLGKVIGQASAGQQAYINSGTVRNTGTSTYFQVNVGGVTGYVSTKALCPQGQANPGGGGNEGGNDGGGNQNPDPAPGGGYDSNLAKQLADEAYAGSVGYSMGRCYEYAWRALKRVTGITEGRASQLGIPVTSAYQFGDWADQNPSALLSDFGLKKINSTAANAPVGSVVVWDPGQCGFSYTHGHIEIVASPGYACSDFCGYMYNDCGAPRVYMPVTK